MVVESAVQKSDRVRAKKKLAERKEEGNREGGGSTHRKGEHGCDAKRERKRERDKRAN